MHPGQQKTIPLTEGPEVDACVTRKGTAQPLLRFLLMASINSQATEEHAVDTIPIPDEKVISILDLEHLGGGGSGDASADAAEQDKKNQEVVNHQGPDAAVLAQGQLQSLLPQLGQ